MGLLFVVAVIATAYRVGYWRGRRVEREIREGTRQEFPLP
jgi:hypothetical protein